MGDRNKAYYDWVKEKESWVEALSDWSPLTYTAFGLSSPPTFYPSQDLVESFTKTYCEGMSTIISVGNGICLLESLIASPELKVYCFKRSIDVDAQEITNDNIELLLHISPADLYAWLDTKNIDFSKTTLLFASTECEGFKPIIFEYINRGGKNIVMIHPISTVVSPNETSIKRYMDTLRYKLDISTRVLLDPWQQQIKITKFEVGEYDPSSRSNLLETISCGGYCYL